MMPPLARRSLPAPSFALVLPTPLLAKARKTR
jgi:hypothetical protein